MESNYFSNYLNQDMLYNILLNTDIDELKNSCLIKE